MSVRYRRLDPEILTCLIIPDLSFASQPTQSMLLCCRKLPCIVDSNSHHADHSIPLDQRREYNLINKHDGTRHSSDAHLRHRVLVWPLCIRQLRKIHLTGRFYRLDMGMCQHCSYETSRSRRCDLFVCYLGCSI